MILNSFDSSRLSSPEATDVSLPPFDLSIPSTTHRSATPLDFGRPVIPHDPITGFLASLPRENSWLSEPVHSGSTMSSFSFSSSGSRHSHADKTRRNGECPNAQSTHVNHHIASPSATSVLYHPYPFMSANPTPLAPNFRASTYSTTTAHSSISPLSPPPTIPLPPTPSLRLHVQSRERPTTPIERPPTEWASSTRANISTNVRPATEAYSITVGAYSARIGSSDTARNDGNGILVGTNDTQQKLECKERWVVPSSDEVEEWAEVTDRVRLRRRACLGLACLTAAWSIFVRAVSL